MAFSEGVGNKTKRNVSSALLRVSPILLTECNLATNALLFLFSSFCLSFIVLLLTFFTRNAAL